MPLRKEGKREKPVAINLMIADGGMGDHLCYLVVADYIVKNIYWVKPFIWVPDYLYEFAKNVLPKEAKVNTFTNGAKYYNEKLLGISTGWSDYGHTPMRIHPIDYAAHRLIDSDLTIEQKNYLRFNPEGIDVSKYKLPEKYVVISVGVTTKTKELPKEVVQQIVDYVIEKGYTPVFLGKSASDLGYEGKAIKANMAEIDYNKGIDLRNQTSLTESAAVIAGAKAIVGMEGGLTHLAGSTDTPIIAGYSIVSPEQMMPIRNYIKGYNVFPVIAEASLECRYCQTKTPLLYSANYYYCYFDDYKCLKQLTFNKWKQQIDKVL